MRDATFVGNSSLAAAIFTVLQVAENKPAAAEESRQLQRRDMETENITNLTDVSIEFATGGIKHTLVTGLELTRETTDSRNSSQTMSV